MKDGRAVDEAFAAIATVHSVPRSKLPLHAREDLADDVFNRERDRQDRLHEDKREDDLDRWRQVAKYTLPSRPSLHLRVKGSKIAKSVGTSIPRKFPWVLLRSDGSFSKNCDGVTSFD